VENTISKISNTVHNYIFKGFSKFCKIEKNRKMAGKQELNWALWQAFW
jgi:hypothetical protein